VQRTKNLKLVHFLCTKNLKFSLVQRNSYAKTKQSLKVSDVKIWNDLPKNIRDKAMILSNKGFLKLLKNIFLQFKQCLNVK